VARIGSDRARKTTLQALRKEWENLAFKPGEDGDDFALCLNTLQQKMLQFSDKTYSEERSRASKSKCLARLDGWIDSWAECFSKWPVFTRVTQD
jgi:hypothetical protein